MDAGAALDSRALLEELLVGAVALRLFAEAAKPAAMMSGRGAAAGEGGQMRGLFLTRLHSRAGAEGAFAGTLLHTHLAERHEVAVAHAVTDAMAFDGRDIVSVDAFAAAGYDFVYLEGGLTDRCGCAGGQWRVPQTRLQTFVDAGGIVVVADAGVSEVRNHAGVYEQAAALFGAQPDFRDWLPGGAQRDVTYGVDGVAHLTQPGVPVCYPSEMVLSDWLRPVYDGVGRVAAVGPCVLVPFTAAVLATGNAASAATLRGDAVVDERVPFVWATVARSGAGFAVLVGGGVSDDWVVGQVPDNAVWVGRLLEVLADADARDAQARQVPVRVALERTLGEQELLDFLADVNRRRNRLERALRALVAAKLGDAPDRVLAAFPADRRAAVAEMDVAGMCAASTWLELTQVAAKNFPRFERVLGDKRLFQEHAAVVNHRPDAHAKDATVRDVVRMMDALDWLAAKLVTGGEPAPD